MPLGSGTDLRRYPPSEKTTEELIRRRHFAIIRRERRYDAIPPLFALADQVARSGNRLAWRGWKHNLRSESVRASLNPHCDAAYMLRDFDHDVRTILEVAAKRLGRSGSSAKTAEALVELTVHLVGEFRKLFGRQATPPPE